MSGRELLIGNPLRLSATIARALEGRVIERDGTTAFVSSEFDPFLNQSFVAAGANVFEAVACLEGRPAFVWLAEEPTAVERVTLEADGFVFARFYGMTAHLGALTAGHEQPVTEIERVRSPAELTAWHGVYCEGLGADQRSHDDWQRLQTALGAMGEESLVLTLARSEGEPAAIAATFTDGDTAGFYCFATRPSMRRRGLATSLLNASCLHALGEGATRALLQATDAGKPIYKKAGFRHADLLPLFIRR